MQDKQLTRHNVPHNTVPYASQPTSNKQWTRNKIAPTLLPSGNQTRDRPLKNCNHQIMDTSTILTGQMQKIPFQDIWSNHDRSKNIVPSHLSTSNQRVSILSRVKNWDTAITRQEKESVFVVVESPHRITYFHNGHPGHSQYLGRPHPTLPRHVDLLHCHLWA